MTGRRDFLLGAGGVGTAILLGGRASGAAAELDVAYLNAKVWTGRTASETSDAVGAVGDKVAALGAAAVKARIGKRTQVIDLGGAFVTPGFTDCHTHFTKASFMLSQASLRDASTPAEFVQRIAKAAASLPSGEWLQGGNWDHDRWGGEMPNKGWLDPVTPNTPVAVIRYDLHTMVLNSLALKLAGINRDTPEVPGGVIERDAAGEPTGIIKDAAKNLVLKAIGPATPNQIDAANRKGIALGLSKGVTQVHTPELEWITHESVRRLHAAGDLGMRFYSFVPLKDWEKLRQLIAEQGRGDDWVRWGGCKVVFDGSLGSRTALFYEPYMDDPNAKGVLVTDPTDLKTWMTAADRAGLQVAAHAIGDEANDIVLDTMAAVAVANGRRDRRFRIEHAQHLRPAAIARFAKQNVIASVQPYHAVDDGRWAIRRIGPERLKTTYAFHSLLAAGAHVCMGSDWPVAPLDPLTGLKAAVLRETLDGKNPGGWYPEQKISLIQALAGYTTQAAYAGFHEAKTGVLHPGRLADLVVWDRDLLTIGPETLDQAKVLRTVVGGQTRFG